LSYAPDFKERNVAVLLQTKTKAVMTYEIADSNLTLSISADEMNEVNKALELNGSNSELPEA
jgi:hypothetical protein